MATEFKYGDITSGIIAAAIEVHKELGNGFQEVVYQRSLEIELKRRNLTFGREVEMPIYYKGMDVGTRRVDFIIAHKISVELKAITELQPVHLAQAVNYLEAFNLEIGLLVNFGAESLQVKRLFNKKYRPQIINN